MKKTLLNIVKTYVVTWLIIVIWFSIRAVGDRRTLRDSFEQLLELLTYKQFVISIHLLFLLLYLMFLIIRYFIRVFKKKGAKTMLIQIALRLIIPITLIVYGFNFIVDNNTKDGYQYAWETRFENKSTSATNHFDADKKHRGMSVFGWHIGNKNAINDLIKNNVEWVAVIPFFYQKDEQTVEINSIKNIGKWSRRDSTFLRTIHSLHDKGIRVNLKPHLWVSSGWRSNLKLDTDEDWSTWFKTYKNVMLHYALMAEETNVELLCIGTELKTSIKQQPEAWKQLIKEIKDIYSGKLTYAANWHDEYEHVGFWEDMDYIGIQGYFPLTDHKNPKFEDIVSGWETHKTTLKSFSKLHKKPILFTEIGYRSDASTTVKPWEWNSLSNIFTNQKSTKAQQLAFEAMFTSLWNESWFEGCYIWQWDTRTTKERAAESFDFSPRYKPAENIIAKWYGNYSSLQK